MTELAILDLGYGNIRSVALAFERLGQTPVLTADPAIAEGAVRLVLPGVGAAGAAMARLRETGLDLVLLRRRRPILGICLGMQLLFDRSEEDGGTDLLGLLPGAVEGLVAESGFPVPHMGWSKIDDCAQESRLAQGSYVYFAHSFVCPDSAATSARVRYGKRPIPAAIHQGPLWGAQFHPERSSTAGADYLKAFLQS